MSGCLYRRTVNTARCTCIMTVQYWNCSRSEDEYRWYWHQMIYYPETINTISTRNTISTTLSLVSSKLAHTTHSVHAGIQKPWRSRLPQPSVVFSFCHVLPLPLSGLNWPSLFLPRGFWPLSPKMASLFTGSARPPLPGSDTGTIYNKVEFCLGKQSELVFHCTSYCTCTYTKESENIMEW